MSARPPECLGLAPSIGFGDRIGLATPGHIAAMKAAGAGFAPIYAQQSIREMARTARQPAEVMDDALQAVDAANWSSPHGADADHLKTPEDVDRTAAAGFTFFTIDPSDYVDQHADDYEESLLAERFAEAGVWAIWADGYRGRQVKLPTGTTIDFDEAAIQRAAVKYGRAIHEAIELAGYIKETQTRGGRDYEIELSVDETEQPTTLVEHYIIADQCLRHGMKLISLAPRFIGDFEKGVDYLGDVSALESSLNDHAAIAEQLGPYKLSLHSGSDKLAMYPAFARATKGRFHVKTAGTSYLEALRVAAIHEPELFREVCSFARDRYNAERATYHVHATLENVPAPAELPNARDLEAVYLERWEDVPAGRGFSAAGRQILHCTFGSVLTDNSLGTAVKECLRNHADAYAEILSQHFGKHLEALTA